MTGTTLRHPGDPVPASGVNLPGGRTLQRVLDGLAAVDASILELSVNDEATRRDLIARHGLRFPVGHSADSTVVADTAGALADPDPPFLQSAGVVLDPGGRAIVSVYSSAAPGAARPARRHRPHPLPARTRPRQPV